MRHREAAILYDAVHWITPTTLAGSGSVGWPALIMGGVLIGYPVSTSFAAGSTTGCLRGSVELCVFPVSQGAADRAPCMLCHSSCGACCEHSSALNHVFIRCLSTELLLFGCRGVAAWAVTAVAVFCGYPAARTPQLRLRGCTVTAPQLRGCTILLIAHHAIQSHSVVVPASACKPLLTNTACGVLRLRLPLPSLVRCAMVGREVFTATCDIFGELCVSPAFLLFLLHACSVHAREHAAFHWHRKSILAAAVVPSVVILFSALPPKYNFVCVPMSMS